MKKILILSVADLRHMTCASSYCEFFEKNNIPFDIICTDRYEEKAFFDYKCSIFRFPWRLSAKASKLQKVHLFVNFYFWAKRFIKENQYRFVVVWNENTALLFGHFLKKKYKGRYAVNVRDLISDLEKNLFIRHWKKQSLQQLHHQKQWIFYHHIIGIL